MCVSTRLRTRIRTRALARKWSTCLRSRTEVSQTHGANWRTNLQRSRTQSQSESQENDDDGRSGTEKTDAVTVQTDSDPVVGTVYSDVRSLLMRITRLQSWLRVALVRSSVIAIVRWWSSVGCFFFPLPSAPRYHPRFHFLYTPSIFQANYDSERACERTLKPDIRAAAAAAENQHASEATCHIIPASAPRRDVTSVSSQRDFSGTHSGASVPGLKLSRNGHQTDLPSNKLTESVP